MDVDVLLAVNFALVAGNVYFLLRARARVHALRRTAEDFTRRLLTGRVMVVNADTGIAGRLVVAPAGDDMLCLYVEPPDAAPLDPPAIH